LVVELPEPVEPVAPLAPEPVLPKWASHSEREIRPSLFLSTDENVGAEVLELDDIPEEPLAPPLAEPEAEGVDLPLLLDDELCAIATPERANSAAAVALVTNFSIDQSSLWKSAGRAPRVSQAPCRKARSARRLGEIPRPLVPA
jgi:hypothetical protein